MTPSDAPLRAARLRRGWSQSRAADEIAALAGRRGIEVAARLSLKTQLSRWENLHAVPDEHYRLLLGELYEASAQDLGLAEPAPAEATAAPGPHALGIAFAESAAIDSPAVEMLRAALRATRALDERLGTAASAGSARAQLQVLDRARRHSTDVAIRHDLAELAADAALLCGSIARDEGRPDEAWAAQDVAAAAAREAKSASLLALCLSDQATILVDAGRPEQAVALLDQVRSLTHPGPPGPVDGRARVNASLGSALAATGDRSGARGAFAAAEEELTTSALRIDVSYTKLTPAYFDVPALCRFRGHALRVLRDDRAAIDDLLRGLDAEVGSVRDRAGAHLDLARAYAGVGEPEEARRHTRTARELVTRIGSRRLAAELDTSDEPAEHPPGTVTGRRSSP